MVLVVVFLFLCTLAIQNHLPTWFHALAVSFWECRTFRHASLNPHSFFELAVDQVSKILREVPPSAVEATAAL
eukprot:2249948-Amphidinium_carterae.1